MNPAEPLATSIHIEAPPARVFAFFTEPDKVCRWLAEWADLEPAPGGRLALDIRGTPVRGRFLEIEEGRRLVMAWGHAGSAELPPGSSRVEITFTDEAGGTRVDLIHHDLPDAQRASHRRGWQILLDALADLPVDTGAAGDRAPGRG